MTEDVPGSGTIKRTRFEEAEPIITYEAFVEDLDRGLSESLSRYVSHPYSRPTARHRGRTTPLLPPRSQSWSHWGPHRAARGPCASYPIPHLSTANVLPVADLAEYLSRPPDELDVDENDDEYGCFVPVMEGGGIHGRGRWARGPL